MTEEYRDSGAKPSSELARLAREGRAARETANGAATGDAQANADRHLREALATIHGAPNRTIVKSLGGLCMMVALLMVLLNESVPAPVGLATIVVAFILTFAGSLMSPRASDGALDEERAWARALPFELEGYFESLSVAPRSEGTLRAHITWRAEESIDEQLLTDAFAVHDTSASVESVERTGVVYVSGPISGHTGSRINREPVLRNHKYPDYIHDLAEKVLVPLSKSYAIERVRLEAT